MSGMRVGFAARMGAATGKLLVRLPITVGIIWFVFWTLGDRAPTSICWFISGMVFNDFWNMTSEPSEPAP